MEYDSGIPMSVTEGHSSALTPSLREGSFANFGIVYLFLFPLFLFRTLHFFLTPFFVVCSSGFLWCLCFTDPFRCTNVLCDCLLVISDFWFRSVLYESVLLPFCSCLLLGF